jgi:hypothetical protein
MIFRREEVLQLDIGKGFATPSTDLARSIRFRSSRTFPGQNTNLRPVAFPRYTINPFAHAPQDLNKVTIRECLPKTMATARNSFRSTIC